MKSEKEIVLLINGNEQRFPLSSERLLIGRDPSCEIAIQDPAISRKHAAILHKFDAIYIENISATGRITKNQQEVEYVQLEEGEEVGIGDAVLYWQKKDGAAREAEAPRNDEATFAVPTPATPEASQSPNDVEFSLDAGGVPIQSQADSAPALSESEEPPSSDPVVDAVAENAGDFEIVSSDDKTRVQGEALHPVLKITKGEEIGREIKLDFGQSWTVGRIPQCEVFIDNPKLSRQHFKINKVGAAYRVEDLGSANGTRLNGVSVKDAPLQPFDTIQAGPVEIQFVIVDAEKFVAASSLLDSVMPLNMANDAGPSLEGGGESTQFLPPEVVAQASAFQQGTNPFAKVGAFSAPMGTVSGVRSSTPDKRSAFAKLPKEKKILYGSLAVFLLLAGVLLSGPSPQQNTTEVASVPTETVTESRSPATETPPPPPPEANAADPKEISSDFSLLSTDKQNEVQTLYGKAERARSERNWRVAYDSSKAVLNIVKRYKKATEILDEAQSYLNEEQIGILSKSSTNIADAALDTRERVRLLVENGEKALGEKRWEDAKESFSKAMNLDPTNEKATQGFAAAHAKKTNVVVNVPTSLPQPLDPIVNEREKDEIDALKRRYQDARSRFNSGAYRESIPIFKDIDEQIQRKMDDYDSDIDERAPATIRKDYVFELKSLQSRVREGLESGRSQLRAEYQSQLADADQFVSNRQYIEARETYDRILRREPNFEDVVEAREKLYAKIMTEAKTVFQESLIYESVSDLDNAAEGYRKTKDLLTNVNHPTAIEYYKKAAYHMKRLQK